MQTQEQNKKWGRPGNKVRVAVPLLPSLLEILYMKHACFNVFHAWMHVTCMVHAQVYHSMHGACMVLPSMHDTCMSLPLPCMKHAWFSLPCMIHAWFSLPCMIHAWFSLPCMYHAWFSLPCMKHACFLCSFSNRPLRAVPGVVWSQANIAFCTVEMQLSRGLCNANKVFEFRFWDHCSSVCAVPTPDKF